jgi:hypothetical protein
MSKQQEKMPQSISKKKKKKIYDKLNYLYEKLNRLDNLAKRGTNQDLKKLMSNIKERSKTYFIGDEDFIKIGTSTRPRRRLKSLQTANPKKIKLLHTTYLGEKALHKKFEKNHKKGEWFFNEKKIKNFIETDIYDAEIIDKCRKENHKLDKFFLLINKLKKTLTHKF